MKNLLVIFVVVAAGVAWACAPAVTAGPPSPAPGPGTDRTSEGSSTAEQAVLADSVRRAYTQADVDFMAGMIHHHAQALVMSRMAPTHGASPSLRILAERIINAQNDEIALMQRWLRDHGEPVPDPETAGVHGMMDGAHAVMPGMLTADQMTTLDAGRSQEFDRLFLQYMIQHHQGALTMVEELVGTQGAAREESVFKLASDIGADQASEISRMRTMLRELLFAPDDDL